MIAKKIFYCWFGYNELSKLNKSCMESWKKNCPDYEIIRIDESNFDIEKNEYVKQMYAAKNWAFVADVARAERLANESGFYLDTDMELYQSLDSLANEPSIVAQAGFGLYGNGILGRGEKLPWIYERMNDTPVIGEALYERMNRLVYSLYDTHAGDKERYEDVTLLGDAYVNINDESERKPETIARHHNECTWRSAWKGGFEMFSDLVPLVIYTNGQRNHKAEEVYNGKAPVGILTTEKEQVDFKDLECANVLCNKNVISVQRRSTKIISIANKGEQPQKRYADNQNETAIYML